MSDEVKYIRAKNVEVPVVDDGLTAAEVQDIISKFEGGEKLADSELKSLVASIRISPVEEDIGNKNCNVC